MVTRFAVPFLILAVLFVPLPFVLSCLVFAVLLAIRPRGEPGLDLVLLPASPDPASSEAPPR